MESENEKDRRYTNNYPECDPWELSSSTFPSSDAIYQDIGQSFGGFITPAIGRSDGLSLLWKLPRSLCKSSSVAKCVVCGAYINRYCDVSYHRWACSVCGHRSGVLPAKSRYRSEKRFLPELNDSLVDFPAPLLWDIRDTDATANVETSGGWLFGDPGPSSAAARDSRGIDNIMGEYVTHRPLVHVFLIQETMDVDCHEMVVEAICAACKNMHPDISIVLVTFGARVAVYRLLDRIPHPVRQHVHIVSVPTGEGEGDGTATQTCILDGRDCCQLFPPPQAATTSAKTSGSSGRRRVVKPISYLMPVVPLQCSLDFMKTRTRVGDCRSSLRAALQTLILEGTRGGREHPPKMMLGPALHAVVEWITTAYSPGASSESEFSQVFDETKYRDKVYKSHTAGATGEEAGGVGSDSSGSESEGTEGSSVLGTVINSLAGAFKSGLGLSDDVGGKAAMRARGLRSGDVRSEHGVDAGTAAAHTRHLSPVERCSGVQLHVFISGAEEIMSEGVGHASLRPNVGSATPKRRNYCGHWAQKLGNFCAERSIAVNVFSVQSFDTPSAVQGDLLKLRMLTDISGGKAYPLSINQDKRGATLKLGAMLSQLLAATQYSTKGFLKLRGTASVLDVQSTRLQGPCVAAADLSPSETEGGASDDNSGRQVFLDLYRLPCMTPTSNLSFVAQYYRDSEAPPNVGVYGASKGIRSIVLQCAYSYETIVESELDIPQPPYSKKARVRVSAAPAAATAAATTEGLATAAEPQKDNSSKSNAASASETKAAVMGGGLMPALHTPLVPLSAPAPALAATPAPASAPAPEPAPVPVVKAPTTTIISKYKITRPPPRPALRTQAALAAAKTPSPPPEPAQAALTAAKTPSPPPEPAREPTPEPIPEPIQEVVVSVAAPEPALSEKPLLPPPLVAAQRSQVFDDLGLGAHIMDFRLLEHVQNVLGEHCDGRVDPRRIGINCQERHEIRSNKVTQAAALLDSYNSLGVELERTEEEVSLSEGAEQGNTYQYQCFYSHGKALVAVRRLRVITIAISCASSSSIQGLIRGIQPTNHAILTLRSLLLAPIPDRGLGQDHLLDYNSANTSTSALSAWLIRYRQELSHSVVAAGVGEKHLEMVAQCPLFLHITALVSSYTLILFDEFNYKSKNDRRERGAANANTPHTSTVESLLNEVVQAPQIQLLLHLLHGMQDVLSSCVKTMAYRSGGGPAGASAEPDEEDMADELMELLASSDQFAHLLSLVFSCDPFVLDRYFYPKLYGLDSDLLMMNAQKPDEERTKGISSLLPLQRQALITGGNYSAFLMDAGSQLMVYRPMASKSNHTDRSAASAVRPQDKDMRVDVLESDDWVVNDILRRRAVNPASAFTDCIHAESGTANSDLFNRYLLDDTSAYALSYVEYESLLRRTVVEKIRSVLE